MQNSILIMTLSSLPLRLALSAAPLALASTGLGQATFSALPPATGDDESSAGDVASDGTVVGGSILTGGVTRPAIWTLSGGVSILPTTGPAKAISRDGSTIVGDPDPSTSAGGAWRWTASGGVQLLSTSGELESVEDVSADGSVVVGNSAGGAMRWTSSGGASFLGPQLRGAWACSADGNTVVGWLAPFQPYRWHSSGGLLTPLGAWDRGEAWGVTADGETVVGAWWPNCCSQSAARWSAPSGAATLVVIPTPTSIVRDVSADGRTMVGFASTFQGSVRAAIWTGGAHFAWLDDWLRARGALIPAGWHLEFAVAMSDDGRFVVGTGRDPAGQLRGWRAELFSPLGDRYCTLQAPNGTGAHGVLLASGSDVVADDDLTLHAGQLNPFAATLFLVAPSQGLVISPGGAQGNLCLDGGVGRFVDRVRIADAFGYTSAPVDLTALPLPSGSSPVAAGETWSFQAWYRDLNPGPTSNYTDALSITFR